MIVRREYWHELNQKVRERRRFETRDIVERLGCITPEQITISNHPIDRPTTSFNPSLKISGDEVTIYARITLGYYSYSSAVVEFTIPLEDAECCAERNYIAKLAVVPSNRYDFWGVEDPRVNEIDGRLYMTYCGRTVSYFEPERKAEKTLPVTAVLTEAGWRKIAVFRMEDELRSFVASDKNAFVVKAKRLYLFHRLHMLNDKFYLSVCEIPEELLHLREFREVIIGENITVLEQAGFEEKIGWATPPIRVNDEYVVLIHGVDRERSVYRIFAVLMNEEGFFTAVTPFYIMEPREIYEVYGDRPYVVFPCGADLKGEYIYISYGAADSVIALGRIRVETLLDILSDNRV